MKIAHRFRAGWHNTSSKNAILTGIVLAILLIIVGLFVGLRDETETAPQTKTNKIQKVDIARLSDLQHGISLPRTALLQPAKEAPIIARAPGRLTKLSVHIGDAAKAGTVIGKIDGGLEPNPLAAQVKSAANVSSLFNLIEQQSLISAGNAVALAQQSLQAAQAGQQISLDTQRASLSIASNGLDQALLSARNAEDTDIHATIDAANLGVEAAQLARDLARSQMQAQNRGSTDAIATATINVRSAQIAQERTQAELASQRAQLQGQLASLQEQLRLQEIIVPLDGTISTLAVTQGSFVSSNQEIGTIVTVGSGQLELEVPGVIANGLQKDTRVPVHVNSSDHMARVDAVSEVSSDAGLFNVVLVIDAGVAAGDYGKQALIEFQPSLTSSTHFIPLDAIVIRSGGPAIFTVSSNGFAEQRAITIHGYYGDVAEVSTTLTPSDQIITSNTRLLQDGSAVTPSG